MATRQVKLMDIALARSGDKGMEVMSGSSPDTRNLYLS